MGNRTHLISVIIPCYNGEKFIKETIQSVLDQTYSPIEILVVDDGSTDKSFEIASTFNEVCAVKQDNSGVAAARNVGFEQSKGDFVCFLDADDWLYPNTIEDKLNALLSSNAAISHGKAIVTDENLIPTGDVLIGAKDNTLQALLNYSPPAIPCPSNALIARWAIDTCGLFDTRLSTSADYEMWIRIASKYEVVRVDSNAVKYRQHGSNMFANLELQLHDMELIFDKHSSQLNFKIGKQKFYSSIVKSYLKSGRVLKALKYLHKSI